MDSKLIWEIVVVLEVNFYAVSINLTKLTLLKKTILPPALELISPSSQFNGKKTDSFKKHILSTYYLTNTIPRTWDVSGNKHPYPSRDQQQTVYIMNIVVYMFKGKYYRKM